MRARTLPELTGFRGIGGIRLSWRVKAAAATLFSLALLVAKGSLPSDEEKTPMDGPRLCNPPRPIPLFLGIQCVFGDVAQQIGWFFLSFGLLLMAFFGGSTNIKKEFAFSGDLGRTNGTVLGYEKTGIGINDENVVEYSVEYVVDGSTFEDTCFFYGVSI